MKSLTYVLDSFLDVSLIIMLFKNIKINCFKSLHLKYIIDYYVKKDKEWVDIMTAIGNFKI